jgi:hypothetical protein
MKKMSTGEKKFSEYLTQQGKTWRYEPCQLDTGVPCKKWNRNIIYTPAILFPTPPPRCGLNWRKGNERQRIPF